LLKGRPEKGEKEKREDEEDILQRKAACRGLSLKYGGSMQVVKKKKHGDQKEGGRVVDQAMILEITVREENSSVASGPKVDRKRRSNGKKKGI